MILKNSYWFFKNELPHKFCDDLIKHAKLNEENKKLGIISGLPKDKLTKKELKKLKKRRHSDIIWMNDQWIYQKIVPYINAANKNAGWNFDFDWSETCQFTEYKKNQYYDWHCDTAEDPYVSDDININGKIRKLSVTVSLTDPSTYKGGDFQIQFRNREKVFAHNVDEIKGRGSIIVFPSHIFHRVTPVTKGTRYSLVIWSVGKPFK